MKNLAFAFLFFTTLPALFSQNLPKKYVLLEHFTNSKCPICGSKNPAFYDLIANYPDDVRHLAIHPPVPYNSCLLYLANATENVARSNYYGIDGTPRVALNGTLIGVSTPLLPAAILEAALNQTSPIAITVSESGVFPTKSAFITVRTYGAVPPGNYKLFAAVAESTVNYTSPNGEAKHHDVFRAMLPNINGADLTPPAIGGKATFSYNYTYTAPNGWTSNYDSLYVLAFVQNTTTGEILNTGTRFDPVFVSTGEAAAPEAIQIQPNPASNEAWASLPGQQVEQVDVFSINGSLMRTSSETQSDRVRIPVDTLPPGIYLVKITTGKANYIGKMVKE